MKCTCSDDFPAEVFHVRIQGRINTFSVCWACRTYEWHSSGVFSGEAMSVQEANKFCIVHRLEKRSAR